MDSPAREWWDVAFVLLMLGWPGPVVLWWKNRQLKDVSEDICARVNQSIRTPMRCFLTAWIVLFLFLLGWTILALFNIHPLGRPLNLFWLVFGAFHLLWWPFAMPIMNRLNHRLEESGAVAPLLPTETVRTAPLKPRRLRDYVPPYGFPLVIALVVAGPLMIFCWYLWRSPEESRLTFSIIIFAVSGAGELPLWLYCMRISLTERLPTGDQLDASSSEIERTFRIRVMYWAMIGMALILYGAAVMMIEVAHGTLSDQTAGMIGGLTGATAGIVGGCIGTMMSLRAHRLRQNRPKDAGISSSE